MRRQAAVEEVHPAWPAAAQLLVLVVLAELQRHRAQVPALALALLRRVVAPDGLLHRVAVVRARLRVAAVALRQVAVAAGYPGPPGQPMAAVEVAVHRRGQPAPRWRQYSGTIRPEPAGSV